MRDSSVRLYKFNAPSALFAKLAQAVSPNHCAGAPPPVEIKREKRDINAVIDNWRYSKIISHLFFSRGKI